jgi:hypothetical protein
MEFAKGMVEALISTSSLVTLLLRIVLAWSSEAVLAAS